jgi:hypothetical protein
MATSVPVALDQGDAGAFHGDVGAGAHGDADVGGGERRCVVDAVAGHGDDAALGSEPLDDPGLGVGQHVGLDLVDAELVGDGAGGGSVVAGQHDDAQAGGLQRRDRRRRRGLDRVGDADEAGRAAIDGDEDGGGAVAPQRLGRGLEGRDRDAGLGHDAAVADDQPAPIDAAGDALAGRGVEPGHRQQRQAAVDGGPHDGGAERMLAAALETGGEAEKLGTVDAVCGLQSDHRGAAFGQRAGLVDDQGVDRLQALQRFRVLDQDARAGAATDADHDRHRGGEPERAGAGDDQHRHRRDQGECEARLGAEQRPGGEGGDRGGDHQRHEPAGDAVGEALDRRARALGLGHHLHDAGEQRLGADLLGAHRKGAGLVERAAGDLGAGRLGHRHRFTGHHRFVDGAATFEDDAVDRYALARPDPQPIAGRDRIERHLLVAAVGLDAGGALRREVE